MSKIHKKTLSENLIWPACLLVENDRKKKKSALVPNIKNPVLLKL